jgi:predicted nucleotidyltransferase
VTESESAAVAGPGTEVATAPDDAGPVSDWSSIPVAEFMREARTSALPAELVSRIILERLPFAFESKHEYFHWRHMLAEGLQVDAREILLVGSAATGRSLSARKKFGVFGKKSDVDIAVISPSHFDRAWNWFRHARPALLGLDSEQLRLFNQHRGGYIFDGMIAANVFLSYLPFGSDWNRELQRSEQYLPAKLRGRVLSVRIYRDSEALRRAQLEALLSYQTYLRGSRDTAEET